MRKLFFNWDTFKGVLAGFVIALGALVFCITAAYDINFMYKALGAFLFSFGLCAVCDEQLNLVTGKFGLFYDGSWKLRQILWIFVTNLFGVLLCYAIRKLDANDWMVVKCCEPLVAARDSKLWYNHIFSGMLCGACIQVAIYNYQGNKSFWGVIIPVMVFILIGGEHCVADAFYYMWAPWSVQHAFQLLLVFIGNFIGATLVVLTKTGTHPHWSV